MTKRISYRDDKCDYYVGFECCVCCALYGQLWMSRNRLKYESSFGACARMRIRLDTHQYTHALLQKHHIRKRATRYSDANFCSIHINKIIISIMKKDNSFKLKNGIKLIEWVWVTTDLLCRRQSIRNRCSVVHWLNLCLFVVWSVRILLPVRAQQAATDLRTNSMRLLDCYETFRAINGWLIFILLDDRHRQLQIIFLFRL